MGVIRQTAGVAAKEKPTRMPQERFSRAGGYCVVSHLFRRASSTPRIRPTEIFREREDDVDADILWTQRTRPQDLEISQRTRDSHSAHIDHLFLGKKNDEENHLRKLSTESDHPQWQPVRGMRLVTCEKRVCTHNRRCEQEPAQTDAFGPVGTAAQFGHVPTPQRRSARTYAP